MTISALRSTTAQPQRAAQDTGSTPTTEEAQPDLVITDIGFTPSPPQGGSKAHLLVTVANQGNAPAGAFEVTVSEDVKGSTRVDGLAAGAKQQLDLGSVSIPQFRDMLRIQGEIDARGEVNESREDNNWIIAYEPVSNPHPPVPPSPPIPPIPVPPHANDGHAPDIYK